MVLCFIVIVVVPVPVIIYVPVPVIVIVPVIVFRQLKKFHDNPKRITRWFVG